AFDRGLERDRAEADFRAVLHFDPSIRRGIVVLGLDVNLPMPGCDQSVARAAVEVGSAAARGIADSTVTLLEFKARMGDGLSRARVHDACLDAAVVRVLSRLRRSRRIRA